MLESEPFLTNKREYKEMEKRVETILERLFYGGINVAEFFDPNKSGLFKEDREKYKKQEEVFHDKLPPELRREYEDVYTDCIIGSSMQNAIYFREGAKIGALIMMDFLSESEEYSKE